MIDINDVTRRLSVVKYWKGFDAAAEIIMRAGAAKFCDVSRDKYQQIIEDCDAAMVPDGVSTPIVRSELQAKIDAYVAQCCDADDLDEHGTTTRMDHAVTLSLFMGWLYPHPADIEIRELETKLEKLRAARKKQLAGPKAKGGNYPKRGSDA